jgi:nucleoid-associated protein YgaU
MFVRILGLVLVILVAWVVFARPSSGSPRPGSYVVKPHDTLWTIAARYYGGDPREGVWKIRESNRLSGATIRVGERLVMP